MLFPEFTQIFRDPKRKTALAVLRAYPGAQAMAAVGVAPIATILQATTPPQLWTGHSRAARHPGQAVECQSDGGSGPRPQFSDSG